MKSAMTEYSLRTKQTLQSGTAVVHRAVNKIEDQTINENDGQNHTFVLNCYFCHHVLCLLLTIILTGLQYPYFHPNGFMEDFTCYLPPKVTSITNGTSQNFCENASAGPYKRSNIFLSVIKIISTLTLLVDLGYVSRQLRRQSNQRDTSPDFILVFVYFLGKHLPSNDSEDSFHTASSGSLDNWPRNPLIESTTV